MALVDMNPGQLLGTLLVLGLFVLVLPGLTNFVDLIVQNTSGVSRYVAQLIIPIMLIAILSNFWGSD